MLTASQDCIYTCDTQAQTLLYCIFVSSPLVDSSNRIDAVEPEVPLCTCALSLPAMKVRRSLSCRLAFDSHTRPRIVRLASCPSVQPANEPSRQGTGQVCLPQHSTEDSRCQMRICSTRRAKPRAGQVSSSSEKVCAPATTLPSPDPREWLLAGSRGSSRTQAGARPPRRPFLVWRDPGFVLSMSSSVMDCGSSSLERRKEADPRVADERPVLAQTGRECERRGEGV